MMEAAVFERHERITVAPFRLRHSSQGTLLAHVLSVAS
jgi:hypothetical protein